MIVQQINNLTIRHDADGLYRVVTPRTPTRPNRVVLEEYGQLGNAVAFCRRTLDFVKFQTVWAIEVNYGQGWEYETAETTFKEARAQVRSYRENAPGNPVRIRRRRERVNP